MHRNNKQNPEKNAVKPDFLEIFKEAFAAYDNSMSGLALNTYDNFSTFRFPSSSKSNKM